MAVGKPAFDELSAFVASPQDIFAVPSFEDLKNVRNQVAQRTCKGRRLVVIMYVGAISLSTNSEGSYRWLELAITLKKTTILLRDVVLLFSIGEYKPF